MRSTEVVRLEKGLTGLAALLLLGCALAPPLGVLRGIAAALYLAAMAAEVVLVVPRVPDALWVSVVLQLTRIRGEGRERALLTLAEAELAAHHVQRCLLLCQRLDTELARRRNGDLLRWCRSIEAGAFLALGNSAAALDCLRAARRLGPLTPHVTAMLARLLACSGRTDADALTVWVEHLRATGPAADPIVVDALCNACRLDEGEPNGKVFQLNQQVAEAAPHLAWAHCNLGVLLLQRGDAGAAMSHLASAAPSIPHADYLLALCRARHAEAQGDVATALQLYRALTTQHPDRPEGFADLARLLVEACDPGVDGGGLWADEAARAAVRACALRPNDALPHCHLGRAHLLGGRPSEAVTALLRAVALDGAHGRWLAEALLAAGDAAAAEKAAVGAVQRDPDSADAWRVVAESQLQGGKREEGMRSLQRALTYAPQAHAMRSRLGHLMLEMARFGEARALFAALPSRTPLDDLALGRCHAAADDFAAAVEAYQRALNAAPDLPRARYHLGCAQAHQGRFADAITALSVEIRRVPADAAAWTQRGHCHLMSGDAAKAVADYRQARELVPHNPSVAYCLARALVTTGVHGEALGLLRPLLTVWPDDADLHLLVGRLCEPTDAKEARVHYECALRLCRACEKGLVRLGVLLCHQGCDAEAVAYLERAAKIGEPTAETLFHLGLVLGRSGRLAEAAKVWGRLPTHPRLQRNLRRLQRAVGADAMRAGDPSAALKAWEPLLAETNDDGFLRDVAEAHLQRGLALLEKGDGGKAGHHLSEAVKLDPFGHAIANLYLALLPLYTGDAVEAASRLAQVRLPGAAQARVDYHRGLALLAAATDHAQALELLTRAAANPLLAARGYPVHLLLAHALVRAGRFEEALAHTPKWAPDLHAWCLGRLDRPGEALAALSSSGHASPAAEHLHGTLLARQGRLREAAERLANAGAPAQDDLVRVLQAWIGACAAARDYAGAGEALTVARRLAPEAAALQPYRRALAPHLTMALLRGGRREDAIRACEQALREAPGDMRATHTLGLMYFWWAHDLEAKRVASLADSAWEGAIRNLVALSRADDWWKRRRQSREKVCGAADDATWQQLRAHLLDHLRRRILDLRNEYGNLQRGESQRRLDQIALKLTVETLSAAELDAVMKLCPPARTSRLVTCGVSMLKHLRLTESAERLLAKARSKAAQAAATERLHWCLSKCATPWVLVEEKRFEEAIRILKRPAASGSTDANDLMARALYEHGQSLLPVAAAADDGVCGAMAAEQALALFRQAKTHVRERRTILADIDKAAEEVGVATASALIRAPGVPAAQRAVSILNETQTLTNSPRVRENLAEVYARLGVRVADDESAPEFVRLHHAQQHLQKSLELNPQNDYARHNMASLLWRHAFNAFKADRWSEALDILVEARRLNPDDDEIERLMSAVLSKWALDAWRDGARKEAKRMLRDALTLDPENEHARDLLRKMRG